MTVVDSGDHNRKSFGRYGLFGRLASPSGAGPIQNVVAHASSLNRLAPETPRGNRANRRRISPTTLKHHIPNTVRDRHLSVSNSSSGGNWEPTAFAPFKGCIRGIWVTASIPTTEVTLSDRTDCDRLEFAVLIIKIAQIVLHEGDEPEVLADNETTTDRRDEDHPRILRLRGDAAMKHLGRPLAGCVAVAAMAVAGTVGAQQPRLLAVTHATVLDVRARLVHAGRDRGRARTDDCVGRRRGAAARRPGRRRAREPCVHARPRSTRTTQHLRSRRREHGAALRRDHGPQRRRADVHRRGAARHGEERTSRGARRDGRRRPPASRTSTATSCPTRGCSSLSAGSSRPSRSGARRR